MIVDYYRPKTLSEALALLQQANPPAIPLAGGTAIKQHLTQLVAAVDLQDLGLDQVEMHGSTLVIGAMVRLQNLLEAPIQESLKQVTHLEATYNLRHMASLAGTLVSADGCSPLATAMLALGAQLTLLPGEEQVSLGDLLPLRAAHLQGRLITAITIPLKARLAYEYVARSPADLPIVCTAGVVWPSGRIRLALGGFGAAPTLAFDGNEAVGVEMAAQSAYALAGDEWASAEYRSTIAAIQAGRVVKTLLGEG